ncbi:hypothetical protein HMPREF0262_03140 [Clostridium sp. ATCC 29733]|nr:hypothetical protein HMPREF0262_03140 [Clostridium sp. ATCC 29733]
MTRCAGFADKIEENQKGKEGHCDPSSTCYAANWLKWFSSLSPPFSAF